MFLPASFQQRNRKASTKGQQQAATAYLGRLALSDISLADLMTQAASLMAQVLSVEHVLISQLDTERKVLIPNACAGWKEQSTCCSQRAIEANSLEVLTLTSQYPILVEDIKEETRFRPSSLLLEHGVCSAISVLIGSVERPQGVLQVFSGNTRTFSQADIYFVQSIANVLGSFLYLKSRETNLMNTNEGLKQELAKAQSVAPASQVDLDLYEIKNRLIASTERERLRLAQELHDVPIQELYGLIYQLEDLKDIVKDNEGGKILDEYDRTLRHIVDSLRTICGELRPPSLSPFGLEVAIRDHVEKLHSQNPDLQFHLELMRDQQLLSDGLKLCLFRIYQQAINNVLRHAEATEVYLRFRWDAEMIILEIEDNGKGFEVPRHWVELVRREHFGLAGLAERMEGVHGKLHVISAPGNGTMVRAVVPRR